MGIIQTVKSIFRSNEEFPRFNGRNWKPAPNTVIRDPEIRNPIETDGYKVVKLMDQPLIEQLTRIYEKHHGGTPDKGGMFYSLYSQDIAYREQVNDEILKALTPLFDDLFENYKTVIGSFIIKHHGPKSEFYLHQDSTGLNEWKYSPLSFWMPLQDTTIDNGCMWVLPKSHGWFSPYRGISFPSMFQNHQDMLRPYMKPIEMKLGEALLFDNRIVHMSGANNSEHPRVIAMAGIFPKEATLISCYRDVENNGPLEIYGQDEDFLLKNLNFYIDCTARPKLGVKVGECPDVKYEYSEGELAALLKEKKPDKVDRYNNNLNAIECDIIQEPR